MNKAPSLLWLTLACLLAFMGMSACDGISETAQQVVDDVIGDDEAELSETELPNCSRVVTCCARLGENIYATVVPDSVEEECTGTLSPAVTTVIDEYQRERSAIDNRTELSEAERADLKEDLREEWQDRVEPGCRCFLEETVGQIADLVVPTDCEYFESVGALEPPAECSDATDALLQAASEVD